MPDAASAFVSAFVSDSLAGVRPHHGSAPVLDAPVLGNVPLSVFVYVYLCVCLDTSVRPT